MKDRVPTQVIDGAIRMEQLDAEGNHLGYIYLKRADEPSEEGTPYNKNNVLTDETATALGLDATNNPAPNDAFAHIAERIKFIEVAMRPTASLYTENGEYSTFTIPEDGYYRLLAVGGGGAGSRSSDGSNAVVSRAKGGAGGGGGVAEAVIYFNKNTIITYTTSDSTYSGGSVIVQGIMAAYGGGAGATIMVVSGSYVSGGEGGAGGMAKALSSEFSVNLYNGTAGQDGVYNEIAADGDPDDPVGGSVTYKRTMYVLDGSVCFPFFSECIGKGKNGSKTEVTDGQASGRLYIEYLGVI